MGRSSVPPGLSGQGPRAGKAHTQGGTCEARSPLGLKSQAPCPWGAPACPRPISKVQNCRQPDCPRLVRVLSPSREAQVTTVTLCGAGRGRRSLGEGGNVSRAPVEESGMKQRALPMSSGHSQLPGRLCPARPPLRPLQPTSAGPLANPQVLPLGELSSFQGADLPASVC